MLLLRRLKPVRLRLYSSNFIRANSTLLYYYAITSKRGSLVTRIVARLRRIVDILNLSYIISLLIRARPKPYRIATRQSTLCHL